MNIRLSVVVTALAGAIASASGADAQVLKKIQEHAKQKIDERTAKATETMVKTGEKTVDSTVEKAGRGIDTAVSKSAAALDTVVSKTEQEVRNAFSSSSSQNDHLAATLAVGRLVLPDLRFRSNSAELQSTALPLVKRLAEAINATPGTFLIEGHVDASGDRANEQALSERRAASVKERLVVDGVSPARLFAIGYGATRPAGGAANGAKTNARIEIARMQ